MPTKIPWTQETWEIIQGCTKVSPGCQNCYAERLANTRLKRFYPGGFGQVVLREDQMSKPLHWRKARMIFPCSRSDLLHESVPIRYILEVFDVMKACPQHIFQVLTKRPERALWRLGLAEFYRGRWPENIWFGVSVENQEWADKRLPLLAQIPARVRFVSLEPLLGPVNLEKWLPLFPSQATLTHFPFVQWVIVGGESGPNHRPMEIQWLADVVAQCKEAGVPVWVKQASSLWPGQQGDIPDDLWALKQYPVTVDSER